LTKQEGKKDDPGVNSRALNELFRVSKERELDYEITVTVAVIEIYNETINDLLIPPAKMKQKK
jgi:kinesin family protein C2/C3